MAGGIEEADKENQQRQIVRAQVNQYKHGSIRKIVFKNFLTYDNLVCHPGPFLNVVIGPNGTGKSSIICGICLAVGGKPNILGRSDNIADFVKHGKQQGSVELHIWDAERRRDMKFTVIMSINKNSATYLRNDQQIKVTELREEISKFNIQVDNPCTFLAQDKVKSFAEQGPKKLLRNTEKAGPEILSVTHDELIELADEGGEYEERVERLEKRSKNLRVEMASRKERVDNYLEWSNRNKTLKSLKLKQFYIEYQHQLELLRETSARVDVSKRQLDGKIGNLEEKERSIRKIENILKDIEKDLTQMKASKKKELAKIRELATNDEQDDKLQKAADDFKRTQNACENWDKDQDELNKDYRKFKQLYDTKKHSIVPDLELPRLEETLQREGIRIRAEEIAIAERQKTLFRLDNQFHSRSNQQKNNLDSKLRNIVQIRNNVNIMHAWDYYTKNRDKFKGPVYVPFLHMQIPNSNNLIYFNNNISPRSMGIFIFSCQEDEQLLLRQFKVDSTIITEQFIQDNGCPKTPISDVLKNFGFIDVLYNMFEAPEAVSVYLNGFHNLDKILIGGPAVDENYERICKKAQEFNPAFRLFMTRKIIVNITTSRFNRGQEYVERNNMNLSIQRFGSDHTQEFDDIDKGMKEVEDERQKLNKRQSKLLEDKLNLKKLVSQYREKQQKKQKDQDELDKLAQQVKKYEERIRMRTTQQEKPSVEEAKKAYTEAKRAIMIETMNNLDKLATMLEQKRESASKYALKSDEVKRLKWRIEGLRREKEGIKEVIDYYKRNYNEAMEARTTMREGVDFAKTNFKEDAKFSPSEEEMSAEQKEDFKKIKEDWVKKKIPEDIDELKEMYRKEQTKALKRQEGTYKDVEDYENLQKELRETTINIEKMEAKNQVWKQKMDEKLETWLNVLRGLVQQICRNFKQCFAHLQCEGLVRLDEPENKYKINEYGIKIFVKFRYGTALRELDCHTQSGGERSVATMIYIMALQNLCPVPFCCVDEINQGMDPTNERAVFNMMVNLLNMGDNVSKTQYFLLTPKLLNGLEFNDRVCVHVVHNGLSIEHPEQWDINHFLMEA